MLCYVMLCHRYVMGTVGTSLIAMMAKSVNVPVLVCCETYKVGCLLTLCNMLT